MFDLVIKDGMILDGSGKEGYVADVAIKDGKIAQIGQNLSGRENLDATGLAVSPGWIDSHSHSDNAALAFPDQKEKIEQGITFSITGQCGGSATPSKDMTSVQWFAQAEATPQGSGSVLLMGNSTLRRSVIGTENREPTPQELEKMKELLAEGMDAGAIGMSFGLIYVPGCYAKTEECLALAEVVAEKGGLLAAHMRNEGDTLEEALEEYLQIAKVSGCRAVVSHHKSAGKQNWGKVKKTLKRIDEANEAGMDVYLDVYPYIASHTSLMATFLPTRFHPPGVKNRVSLLDDPALVKTAQDWMRAKRGDIIDWVILTNGEYAGMTVHEVCQKLGIADDYDCAFELMRMSEGTVNGCFFSMDEADVRTVIAHPRAMICTDSSVAKGSTTFHPRLRASFPRALGRYAREQQVVSIPEMIRKITSLPAHVYGLQGKGWIKEGYDADICIFDPEIIRDQAEFGRPTLPNLGLNYVLVDGKIVVKDGVYNGIRAAKVCRKGK